MPYGWIFSMGTGKYVVDSGAFGKKCTKIPGSLTLPGIFSCTPGRSRTCDLQSRSLTRYPTALRAHMHRFNRLNYFITFSVFCQQWVCK